MSNCILTGGSGNYGVVCVDGYLELERVTLNSMGGVNGSGGWNGCVFTRGQSAVLRLIDCMVNSNQVIRCYAGPCYIEGSNSIQGVIFGDYNTQITTISSGAILNFTNNTNTKPIHSISGCVIVDGGCTVITSAGATVSVAGGTYSGINNDGTTV